MIPPLDQLGLADRELSTTARDGQELRLLRVSRRFAAEQAEVWDALTDPERIPRWIGPVSGDLREGGTFQIEGNAGGSILRCQAPDALAITWEYAGQVSWVDVTLTHLDGTTTLLLEHTAPVDPETWAQFGPGAVGIGWEMALMGFDEHLRSPDADPAELRAWLDSGEGRDYQRTFIHGASTAWARASVAAGTPEDEAFGAAERCTAAYTAWPEDETDAPS